MAHTELVQIADERYVMSPRTKMWIGVLIIVGIVLTTAGIFMHKSGAGHHETNTTVVEEHGGHHGDAHATKAATAAHDNHAEETHNEGNAAATEGHGHEAASAHHADVPWTARLWSNLLINSWFFFLLAVIGTFFIAVNRLANAGWSAGLMRIPEAMGTFLPFALVLLLIPIAFGAQDLYHWMHEGITDKASEHYDAIIDGKSGFLNSGMLYGATIGFSVIFILFTMAIRKQSLKEDEAEAGELKHFKKSIRYSAQFTFLFAFLFSILSWLVVMSVDVHWFSTIFSVYNFATGFVSGIAVMTLTVVFLKSQGYLSFINEDVMHDLGKYMFAFSIFWTYIWLSQYLLIWYANIPEEVTYYTARFNGPYSFHFWTNIALCFFFPFIWFMTRNNKRKPMPLVIGAVVILVGHWSDVYMMVTPGVMQETGSIGLLEIGMPMIFTGLFMYVLLTSLSKANLFPKNHPYLQETVHHDVGA